MVQQKLVSSEKTKNDDDVYREKIDLNPEIRFSEFDSSEWIEVKLKDISNRITRKNKNLITKRPLTISAQYGLVDQEEYFNKTVASKNLEGYYLLNQGEFAYNKSYSNGYPYGAIKRLDNYENGAISTLYICFESKNVDSEFLKEYFETSNWYKEMYKIAVEGARNHGLLNIPINDFFETKHKIPKSIEEQKKIGEFLKIINKKIDLLEKNQIKLKALNYKLINNIMNQNYKIPNQNNTWEKITLKDIGNSYAGLSGKNKDDFNKGNSLFIPYRSVFNDIILNFSNFENVDIDKSEKQNLVSKGDIFFTSSSETPNEVGMASVLLKDLDNCYLNSFCFGFRLNSFEEYNPLFLVYYFRSLKFKKELFKLAQGSTRFNISKIELLKKEIEIPSKIEQDYYVNIINNMYTKGNYVKKQLSYIKNFKKALLQKMFV